MLLHLLFNELAASRSRESLEPGISKPAKAVQNDEEPSGTDTSDDCRRPGGCSLRPSMWPRASG
jgi:hypothetical protein